MSQPSAPRQQEPGSQLRFGLCCGFIGEPIRFRTTTARHVGSKTPRERRELLRRIGADNARALREAVDWCAAHAIRAFRVNSGILPLYTHPDVGYRLDELDRDGSIVAAFGETRERARRQEVRLSFHPDQFVVPGSEREEVVRSSLAELEYQAEIAELIGAEQLTLHGGGARGGKHHALVRLREGLARLSGRARQLIALENDDHVYTVEDLLPLCQAEGLPLVYDVHHHRCNPDALTIEEATEAASETWRGREPWVHISSPREGWRGANPRPHADYVRARDVPACWRGRTLTLDVEAKAKELAVLRLRARLSSA